MRNVPVLNRFWVVMQNATAVAANAVADATDNAAVGIQSNNVTSVVRAASDAASRRHYRIPGISRPAPGEQMP